MFACLLVSSPAGQALHWVYDLEKLKKIVEGLSEPEFLEPSQNPFYVVENGEQSTYGEQFLVQLDSLGECQGALSAVPSGPLSSTYSHVEIPPPL